MCIRSARVFPNRKYLDCPHKCEGRLFLSRAILRRDKSLRVFLAQARGSLYELETQLQLAADLKYVNADRTEALNLECDEVARMINGLLSAIERSSSAAAG